jgi:hypothetical protein
MLAMEEEQVCRVVKEVERVFDQQVDVDERKMSRQLCRDGGEKGRDDRTKRSDLRIPVLYVRADLVTFW